MKIIITDRYGNHHTEEGTTVIEDIDEGYINLHILCLNGAWTGYWEPREWAIVSC